MASLTYLLQRTCSLQTNMCAADIALIIIKANCIKMYFVRGIGLSGLLMLFQYS